MQWTKAPGDKIVKERWICLVPPDNHLRLEVISKGDGRWAWQIFARDAVNPMASGVARNLGAAKAVTEQFAARNP